MWVWFPALDSVRWAPVPTLLLVLDGLPWFLDLLAQGSQPKGWVSIKRTPKTEKLTRHAEVNELTIKMLKTSPFVILR